MPDGEKIPVPTELVYLPRPSWAPALLAFGALMIVNGIYGEGILFRGWVYMLVGAVVALAALRSMIVGAVRDFYERPRQQRQGATVLPAGSLRAPPKQG
ncbi:MAG: hypothetical protein AABM43_13130 [Actinomycetota bacterium]